MFHRDVALNPYDGYPPWACFRYAHRHTRTALPSAHWPPCFQHAKYPNLTREFLFSKGVTQFKLVSSLGATEAYPFTESSEIITDITSSGETLRANNLRILKDGEILKSEACMMASKSSLKNGLVKKLVKLLSK